MPTPIGAVAVGLEKPPGTDGREAGYGRDNAVAADLALADWNDKTLQVRIDQGIELVVGHDLHDPLPQLHAFGEARIAVRMKVALSLEAKLPSISHRGLSQPDM